MVLFTTADFTAMVIAIESLWLDVDWWTIRGITEQCHDTTSIFG
jgi:hypothetical protein